MQKSMLSTILSNTGTGCRTVSGQAPLLLPKSHLPSAVQQEGLQLSSRRNLQPSF